MKLLHIADLHLGKKVNEFDLIEDQRFVLKQIIDVIINEKPQALLIAGDIYDKSVPSTEAVNLFDEFITRISEYNLDVFIISGNHDSADRLSFGNKIFAKSGIHIAGEVEVKMCPYKVYDSNIKINIFSLPYVKMAKVKVMFTESSICNYTDAIKTILSNADINENEINVLIAHQFVTCAGEDVIRSDSESISIGGTDNIDASVFCKFDYVALGHLHGAQKVLRETIRYAGSPLKYSFSEVNQKKTLTLIDVQSKEKINIQKIPIEFLHDMRKIRGPLEKLISSEVLAQCDPNDYVYAYLTDEEQVVDPIGKIRNVYPNIMGLEYCNTRSQYNGTAVSIDDIKQKTPMELFEMFYKLQNNIDLSNEKRNIINGIFEEIGGITK